MPPPAVAGVAPEGSLVTSRAVVCVPGRRFQAGDSGDWELVARASVFCRVTRPLADPLVLRLRPAAPEQGLDLQWQGEPVDSKSSGGAMELTLPPERLSPGLYELIVRPLPRGSPRPVRLSALEYGSGEELLPLLPERREHSLRLLDFLLHRVTGAGPEKAGGWLFDGPGKATVELDPRLTQAGPVRLHLPAENLSSGHARFAASTAGATEIQRSVELVAGGRGGVKLDVPQGEAEIQLAASGPEDGLFLWRAPRVESGSDPRAGARPPGPPPLVLITLDTTRRDALGVYGAPAGVTPVLDELARQATVYDRAYSTTSWTLPSHVSMFTGLYPSRHGAGVRRADLIEPDVTLAELLRDRGYFSAGFAGGTLCASRFGVGRGFQLYRDPDDFETRGDRLTDYALAFLDEHGGSPPFFLFVNYFDPHAPLQAPEELKERMGVPELLEAAAGSPIWQRIAEGREGWSRVLDGEAPVDDGLRDLARALYRAEVAFMDRQIGRLLDELRRRGLYDEALIAVVADHGELLGEGGLFGHAARLDPELVEVPLVVKWPRQRAARRVPSLVTVADLFPTLLEAAGLEPPASDGLSLPREGVREGSAGAGRSFVWLEEHESLVHPLPSGLRLARHVYGIQGLRNRRVVWPQGQDCARREDGGWRPEPCRGEVEAVLDRIRQVLGPPATERSDQGRGMSEEDREALEALGYL